MVTLDLGPFWIERRCTKDDGWQELTEAAFNEAMREDYPGLSWAVFKLRWDGERIDLRLELHPDVARSRVDDVGVYRHTLKITMSDATAVRWRLDDNLTWPCSND